MKGRKVVLLLDDLSDYVGSDLNLHDFGERLSGCAADWVVASTCRDGPELGTVKEATGNGLKQFYEEIPHKLKLLPLAPGEKEQLAASIGKGWNPGESAMYPTPGSITMEGYIRFMKNRFENDLSPEQRDTLRTLKLLAYAGVLPFTRERIRAILEQIFERSPSHLGDCLNELAEMAFLRPGSQEPVEPEPAYLRDAVKYTEGKDPEDDFPQLMAVLDNELRDYEGLFYLGTTYGLNLTDNEQALSCFEKVLSHKPDFPEAWYNKGVALGNLGRYEEAIEAYDEAIGLKPDYPEAWYNKGVALANLEKYEEAVDWMCRAWRAREHLPDEGALVADVLRELGHDPEECEEGSQGGV